MIYVTGDTHGVFNRLSTKNFPQQKEMTKYDIVIILGDFGGIWYGENTDKFKENEYWLDWLDDKPFTTVFIDGNHENYDRLYKYPIKEWNCGDVHEIRPSVLHLMRGNIFNIEEIKFFVMGGASSHDIQDGVLDFDNYKEASKIMKRSGKNMFRINHLSWWKEELPSDEELELGLKNLKKENNKVDIILSHSPSTSEQILMGGAGLYFPDKLTNYLDDVMAKIEFKKHLFGHMHDERYVNDKSICLYESIYRLV